MRYSRGKKPKKSIPQGKRLIITISQRCGGLGVRLTNQNQVKLIKIDPRDVFPRKQAEVMCTRSPLPCWKSAWDWRCRTAPTCGAPNPPGDRKPLCPPTPPFWGTTGASCPLQGHNLNCGCSMPLSLQEDSTGQDEDSAFESQVSLCLVIIFSSEFFKNTFS